MADGGLPGGEVEGHGDEEECAGLEPFFFDEAEAVADHERRILREQEEARRKELVRARLDRIRDYDRQGDAHFTRFFFADLSTFDPDEESSLGPMRYTDRVYEEEDGFGLHAAVNILSVKIVSLDVKFPIHVYGTVVARDSLDRKCVYLFRRDRDDCQVIKSKSESLILDGPKRGLVLIDDTFVEIDLKIKDLRRQRDRDLSKGFLSIRGIRTLKNEIESKYLDTKLSTVEVMYAVVEHTVEATIAIEVLKGEFNGKITAHTTSIPNSLVLHDSNVAGKKDDGGKGVIQLLRSVVTVCVKDVLIIVAQTDDKSKCIEFTPRVNNWTKGVFTCGATKMRVKVTWSIIDY